MGFTLPLESELRRPTRVLKAGGDLPLFLVLPPALTNKQEELLICACNNGIYHHSLQESNVS